MNREELLALAKETDVEEVMQAEYWSETEADRLQLLALLQELLKEEKDADAIMDLAEKILLISEAPEEFACARAAKNAVVAEYGTLRGSYAYAVSDVKHTIEDLPPMSAKPVGLRKLFGGAKEWESAVLVRDGLFKKLDVLTKYAEKCTQKVQTLGADEAELAYYTTADKILGRLLHTLMQKH